MDQTRQGPRSDRRSPEGTSYIAMGRDDTDAPGGAQRANVVALPDRRRGCVGCGIRFRPRAPHHQLCTTCHAGAAAILALGRARRLLAGA